MFVSGEIQIINEKELGAKYILCMLQFFFFKYGCQFFFLSLTSKNTFKSLWERHCMLKKKKFEFPAVLVLELTSVKHLDAAQI